MAHCLCAGCVWELFVRSVADPDCRDIIVWSIAGLSPSAVASRLQQFDLQKVQCFKQEDKEQIMAIIDQFNTGRKVRLNDEPRGSMHHYVKPYGK